MQRQRKFYKCKFSDCEKQVQKNGYCCRHKDGIIQPKASNQKNSICTGDNTEKWVFNQLIEFDHIVKVEKIGQRQTPYDIIFSLKTEQKVRGIQVKTLTLRPDGSYCCKMKKYEKKLLIVGASVHRDFFLLVFSDNCKPGTFHVKKNDPNTYTDVKTFLGNLKEMVCESCEIQEHQNCNNKEQKSIERWMKKYPEYCLSYEDSHNSVVDCYVNNHSIQWKYSNKLKTNTFQFTLQKSKHGKNVSYEESDNIDFFIFEIGGKFEGNFFIIPKSKMLERGYISSGESKGKFSINLPSINYQEKTRPHLKNHWGFEFLNKVELLN